MNTLTRRWIAAGLLMTALVAPHPWTAAAAAPTAQIRIANFTFDPPRLTVPVGATVRWRNEDDIPHLVVADGFRSPALDTDDSFAFTFETAGSYAYFCALHPNMTGTIVVGAPSGKAGP